MAKTIWESSKEGKKGGDEKLKSILVNLENFIIQGNILDISTKGNVVVSEMIEISGKEVEKDFIAWNYKCTSCNARGYDYALAFFSLSSIFDRRRLDKTIKEVKRLLNNNGKLIIWDIYQSSVLDLGKFKIKVILPQKKVVYMRYKVYFNPFRPGYNDILKCVNNNELCIVKKYIKENMFYIEAVNSGEVKNEDNTCSA